MTRGKEDRFEMLIIALLAFAFGYLVASATIVPQIISTISFIFLIV